MISPERETALRDNWGSETNEPWTEEWREDLTDEERELVEKWDKTFEDAYERIMWKIKHGGEMPPEMP